MTATILFVASMVAAVLLAYWWGWTTGYVVGRGRRWVDDRRPVDGPRIALRPDVHGEDPLHYETRLDDIFVKDVPMFRAEQMGPDQWWVCCYLDDRGDRICWSVTVDADGSIAWTGSEYPEGNVLYEQTRSKGRP